MELGISKTLDLNFKDARKKVEEEMKNEGFGLLTEIDVKATMKKKLDVVFRNYDILGFCNPPFAHKALGIDLGVGLLMPCNVIIYETDDGKTHVSAINMEAAAGMVYPEMNELAGKVTSMLRAAMNRL